MSTPTVSVRTGGDHRERAQLRNRSDVCRRACI
jgi:hypothetical protein